MGRTILFIGGIFNEYVLLESKAISPAANRWQKGLVRSLIKQRVSVNLLSHFPEPLWPRGKFYPGEKDEFYQKAKKVKGEKIISDYDHNPDGSIWVYYEINSATRDRKNFRVENSIYDILKGDYTVNGMDHKININNQKCISKLANDRFKNKIKIGDEILFTFNISNRKVDIEIGKNLLSKKYN